MKGQRLSSLAKRLGTNIENENYISYLNDRCIESYGCDSRQIEKNALFFALKGEKTDGHDHLAEVAAKGAAGAVIDVGFKGETYGLPILRVPNVLASLQALAKEVCALRRFKIIGVTGSMGKTTTKEFIAELLSAKFRVAKTPGNSNSQIGLPLAILNLSGEIDVFIAEMGMSQEGEISKLIQIAPPDAVLINRISYSHIMNFSDGLEGVARAKGEILDHPLTAIAVVHSQAVSFEGICGRGGAEKSSYGAETADYFLEHSTQGMRIIEKGSPSPWFQLPFQATHLWENFLGAGAIARKYGLSWDQIIAQSAHLQPFKRRFEPVQKNGVLFINDCYNASPDAVKAALKNLPEPQAGGRKIAVLGSMKELGSFSDACHREVGLEALRTIDRLLCFGDECIPIVEEFKKHGREVEYTLDFEDLKQRLERLMQPGDVVLVKGSNSLRLWRLLEDE